MKILHASAARPTAGSPPSPPREQAPPEPADSSAVSPQPSLLSRVVRRAVRNVVLGALPAAATCLGLALGGPNVAGLCLAGSMVASGLVAARLLAGEAPFHDAFGCGGWFGLISGAAGMMGPAGVGLMAAGALGRQLVGHAVELMEEGEIKYSA